jgi:hypothetical protein
MNFIEQVGVGQERAETGVRTEKDCPPSIGGARVILWIGIAKDSPTEGDKLFVFLSFGRLFGHFEK